MVPGEMDEMVEHPDGSRESRLRRARRQLSNVHEGLRINVQSEFETVQNAKLSLDFDLREAIK